MNEILYHEFDRSYFCEERFLAEVLRELETLVDGYSIVVTSDLKRLPESRFPKLVILTGDEGEKLSAEPYPGQGVHAVFRIFNHASTCDQWTVFPLPCGYNWRMHNAETSVMERFYPELPLSQRPVDLFFAGQVIESRRVMVERLSRMTGRFTAVVEANPSFRTGRKIDDYLRQLGQTKIALVPDGTSADSFRYTEAMASGCIVVMPRKSDLWYYKDAPVAWVDDWAQFNTDFVQTILSSDLDAWGRRARAYYEETLSGTAVARYIASCLQKRNDPSYAGSVIRESRKSLALTTDERNGLAASLDYRVGRLVLALPRALKRTLGKRG